MSRPAVHLDPTGEVHGVPTWPWRCAPAGLLTVRQLRERGLRPGGQPMAGQVLRGRRLAARLYRVELAKAKRTATPAQREAIAKANAARRRCYGTCGRTDLPYIPPRRTGYRCLDCAPAV